MYNGPRLPHFLISSLRDFLKDGQPISNSFNLSPYLMKLNLVNKENFELVQYMLHLEL
jgi:hypothetical protein